MAGGRAWLAGSGYFSSSNLFRSRERGRTAGWLAWLEGFSVDFDPSVNRIYRQSSISKVKGDSPCACSYVLRASTSLSWSTVTKVEFDFVHAIGVDALPLFFIHRFETWFFATVALVVAKHRIWHLFRIIRAELCAQEKLMIYPNVERMNKFLKFDIPIFLENL